MKKIIFAIAIIITLGFNANAQGGLDALVNDWGNSRGFDSELSLVIPAGTLGGIIGDQSGATAPVGSGLLVLTALGAGYAAYKKRK